MNYNPHTLFSEQDYHLLKTHQSSGSGSEVIELNDTKVYFDEKYNYNFDINCVAFIPGDFTFAGSSWSITLPQNYGYVAIKTVMGKAREIL